MNANFQQSGCQEFTMSPCQARLSGTTPIITFASKYLFSIGKKANIPDMIAYLNSVADTYFAMTDWGHISGNDFAGGAGWYEINYQAGLPDLTFTQDTASGWFDIFPSSSDAATVYICQFRKASTFQIQQWTNESYHTTAGIENQKYNELSIVSTDVNTSNYGISVKIPIPDFDASYLVDTLTNNGLTNVYVAPAP